MKWSQLKKRIEATFADAVNGRVEVWNTRYRKSHDQEGEAWITIDGQRVHSMATYTYFKESYLEGTQSVRERGIFPLWEFNSTLFSYLNMSIDDIAISDNPVIRAIGMLDRRFGKKRLAHVDVQGEHPLIKVLYEFRCEVEGLKPKPRPISDDKDHLD